ncbi:mandelate racemase/muconate lactonizing enzyme family protein [Chloroflexota bacterium]
MKITKVEATCHNIPIKLPLDKSVSEQVVFVRVETDEGITGFGITVGHMRFSTREFINRQLAPFLAGKNPLETERIWNKDAYAELDIMPVVLNTSATVSWGFSAVDIALWDIKGKYFNEPVFRLLGGSHNPVPVYVTFGFSVYSREELVEVARQLVQIGQNNLKMQGAFGPTPGLNMAEGEARVRAVREAMGDGGMLMVTGGDRFNFTEAKEFAHRIEPYHITWFDSPVFTRIDYRLLAALRQCTRIPITSCGSVPGRRWFHRELIINGAVDFVQPNVCWVGGYTEALKVAHMGQAFSMPVANGSGQPHHNMHLIAGVANGWIVEFNYRHMLRDETIFVNPPRFERGGLTLPEKAGLGLEPNEAALKEYLET